MNTRHEARDPLVWRHGGEGRHRFPRILLGALMLAPATAAGQPANDNFASAAVLTGTTSARITTSNVGATKEPGEPNHAGNAGGHSLWWKWMAPTNAPVTVESIDRSFPALLAVYVGGSVNALIAVGATTSGSLAFNAVAGTTYMLAVDGGVTGSISVSLEAYMYALPTLAGAFGHQGSADGTGDAARFHNPAGVAVDSTGTVFVSDTENQTVRTVTPAGVVTTLAGSAGQTGSANGSGSAARFNQPRGLSFDAAGNVYVADSGNHTIRKITRAGVVSTFAGAPGIEGSTDGFTGAARFSRPIDLAVDPATGNLYVADNRNNTIRKITTGGTVTTLAGSAGLSGSSDGVGSAARFARPWALAVDPRGDIFVADTANHTIRKVTPGGVVTTFAGLAGIAGEADGAGSAARFNVPSGVTADAAGNLYVCSEGTRAIRKITPTGLVVTILPLPAFPPVALTVDSAGNLYLADSFVHVITKAVRMMSPLVIGRQPADVETVSGQNMTFTVVAPATSYRWERSTDSGTTWVPLTDGATFARTSTAQLTINNATTTMSGDLFRVAVRNDVAATVNSAPARLEVGPGYEVSTFAGSVRGRMDGAGPAAQFSRPAGLSLAADGNLFVADAGNGAVRKVTPAGVVTTVASGLNNPLGVAAADDGKIYILESSNYVVRSLSPGGMLALVAGPSSFKWGIDDGFGENARFFSPLGITAVGDRLFVADAGAIRQIVLPGMVTTLAGMVGTLGSADGIGAAAEFWQPCGIAADKAGNLFVTDYRADTIRKITPTRSVTTPAGFFAVEGSTDGPGASARFRAPAGIAFDASGNMFIADQLNQTLRRISSNGAVTTLAGSPGLAGLVNGRGANVRFSLPFGVAVNTAGAVYVADGNNHVIRKAVPVYDVPGIKSPLIASGTIGAPFFYMIVANSATLRCSAIGLPAGLTVGATTGVISGTPTTTGKFTVALTVTNSTGTGIAELALEIRGTPPPDITTQPVAASVRSGTAARFTVQATGVAALSYQWQTQPAGGSAWSDVADDDTFSGATTSTLLVTATMALNGRQFRAVVRDANGGSTTSSAVALTVTLPPPQITTPPIAASVVTGTSAEFTVAATSAAPLTYRWQTLGNDGVTWNDLSDDSVCSGCATPTLCVAAKVALNGQQYRVVVRDAFGGATSSAAVALTVTLPARLVNLSTRGQCLTADNVLIPGFVITGTTSKRLLIRTIGPGLANFGVSGALADPAMVVKRFVDGSYVDVAANNDWGFNVNVAEIVTTSSRCGAFALQNGSLDAVLLLDLAPGQYTVVASGAGTTTGVAIVELYDAGANSETSRLINIATRGYVGTGDAIMIPGFVVSDEGPRTMLIRAVGPTLGSLGVTGALADPQLTVYRQNAGGGSTVLAGNDDWGLDTNAATTASTAARVGAFALAAGSKDAAIVVTLQPGTYTVQARGVANTTGTALVEVYEAP